MDENQHIDQSHQRLVPGLVGMSVHTDCVYLKAINNTYDAEPHVSRIEILLQAIDFHGFTQSFHTDQGATAQVILRDASRSLERAGAQFLAVTSNTGGTFLANAEAPMTSLPVVDITRAVLGAAQNREVSRLGLLSTRATARSGIYRNRAAEYGCTIIEPSSSISSTVEDVIFQRLIRGILLDEDVKIILDAVDWFMKEGADAVILGCTDLTLFANRLHVMSPIPLFDSTLLHAEAIRHAATTGDLTKLSL